MFWWIVSSSLRFRFLVLFTAMMVVLYGISKLPDMPVDVFPEFAPPHC